MMDRIRRATCGILVAAVPLSVGAQQSRNVHPVGAIAVAPRSAGDLARPAATPARATRAIDSDSPVASAFRTVIGVAGGAVVGGWLGYFTSQVGRSDWDALPTDQKATVRRGYTTTGAALGAVVGYFMRPRIAPRVEGLPQPDGVPIRTGRMLIATKELHRSIATTALEAVEVERPEWISALRQDQASGRIPAGAALESGSVVVYVGDVQMGKLETLRDMSIPEVAELRFYSGRDAHKRWGVDHRYGAIEVVPAGAEAPAPAPAPGG